MPTFRFKLFIAGQSPRSTRAVENLRGLGDRDLEGEYELEIIDVIESPEQAEAEDILATPTVVKWEPGPERRVTGDLSDPEAVAMALGLPR